MKRFLLPAIVLGIFVIMGFESCQKTETTTVTPAKPVPGLASVFSAFRYTPQTFTVKAGRDTTVFGANGTLLHFYWNSFRFENGTLINTGTVNVQLTELYSPADIIRNHLTTMLATGEIVQSVGQVKVAASINGTEIFTNGYGLGFTQHDTANQLMGLFYGTLSTTDSITSWTQSDAPLLFHTKVIATRVSDTPTYRKDTCFYFDSVKSFTWASCSWFAASGQQKVGVSVMLPDTSFNAYNTQLYLVLPKTSNGWIGNAVLTNMGDLGFADSSYSVYTNTLKLKGVGNADIIPAGLNYELIAIANKQGSYYYWSGSGVVPATSFTVSATLAKTIPTDIDSLLKRL